MQVFVHSICVVRLVTAVEAVRRKRKAAVRLWVGLGDEGIANLSSRRRKVVVERVSDA